MARPNNNNKNNNRNYFAQNIQKNGDNFLELKNSRNLELDAPNIFRQLSRGQIDIDKYGHYFLDIAFLEVLLKVAYDKQVYHSISTNCISMVINNNMYQNIQTPQEVIIVCESHRKSAEAYMLIYSHLTQIKNERSYLPLLSLTNNLSKYRNNL